MTLSWHTMMEFEPPLVGCVVSDRNHSFRALKATRDCVINIPTVEIGDTGKRHIPGTASAIPLWRVPSDTR
jgi:flavin reductase (DIM6/NTAB) family NADH-FMN oxidoreductase RutF